MRRALVAGNWKMNGSFKSVNNLLEGIKASSTVVKQVEIAIFPPFPFLERAERVLKNTPVSLGAQNLSHESNGSFTGEISGSMLLDYFCQYVIVGHSERRALYGEDNQLVALKFLKALEVGLKPILCVGETLKEREMGKTLSVVLKQLDAVLGVVNNHLPLIEVVIAYEPIWSIGTGKNATPEQAQEVHCVIRDRCREHNAAFADRVRLLYGGSVKPDNALGLFSMPDIDGALVGKASLNADEFIKIALSYK